MKERTKRFAWTIIALVAQLVKAGGGALAFSQTELAASLVGLVAGLLSPQLRVRP